MTQPRDLLFISHATEDTVFAEWLAMKLAAAGYKVWIDTMELLGGESFTRDIDVAIAECSFRVLAVLSKASLVKPNPTGERAKALAVGKKIGESDFLIPLRLDDFDVADLNFSIAGTTFVPFNESWHTGLTQLLKKLEKLGTPKDPVQGPALVGMVLDGREAMSQRTEVLWSNVLVARQLPKYLRLFELRSVENASSPNGVIWPHRRAGSSSVWAFSKPPHIDGTFAHQVQKIEWQAPFRHDEYPKDRRVIAAGLINWAFELVLQARGLKYDATHRQCYFPLGLLPNDKIQFEGLGGKTHLKVVGDRRFYTATLPDQNRVHLSPVFRIAMRGYGRPVATLMCRFYLTDLQGRAIDPAKQVRRQKRIRRSIYNWPWAQRYLAMVSWLRNGADTIHLCGNGEDALIFEPELLQFQADKGIDEEALGLGKSKLAPEEEEAVEEEAAVTDDFGEEEEAAGGEDV